jgi:protein TonB
MVTGLLESRRRPERRRGGTLVSAAAHAAAIWLAVVATGRAGSAPAPASPPETLVYVARPSPSVAPRASVPSGASSVATAAPADRLVDAAPMPDLAAIAAGIPTVALPAGAFDTRADLAAAAGGGSRGGAPGSGAAGDALPAHLVERPVLALAGNRPPRYPEALRSAGIGGRVVARFVVDTAGRVEPASVRLLAASHPHFAAAVRDALPAMRFLPAEAAGRKVRQLVELPFEFEIQ